MFGRISRSLGFGTPRVSPAPKNKKRVSKGDIGGPSNFVHLEHTGALGGIRNSSGSLTRKKTRTSTGSRKSNNYELEEPNPMFKAPPPPSGPPPARQSSRGSRNGSRRRLRPTPAPRKSTAPKQKPTPTPRSGLPKSHKAFSPDPPPRFPPPTPPRSSKPKLVNSRNSHAGGYYNNHINKKTKKSKLSK